MKQFITINCKHVIVHVFVGMSLLTTLRFGYGSLCAYVYNNIFNCSAGLNKNIYLEQWFSTFFMQQFNPAIPY